MEVPQHKNIRIAVVGGNLWVKIGKDIEFGYQGIPLVEVVVIAPAPEKCFASGYYFDSGEIDPPILQALQVGRRKIVSY